MKSSQNSKPLTQPKAFSQSSRDTPSSNNQQQNKLVPIKSQSQNQANTQSLTKLNSFGSLNSKPLQPVLRQKDDSYKHSVGNQINQKKMFSGAVEQKNQNKKMMKEQPFNYPEQSQTKHAPQVQYDGIPNKQLFKRTKSPAQENISSDEQTEAEEVYELDQNPHYSPNLYSQSTENRPSDEVEYQEVKIDENNIISFESSNKKGIDLARGTYSKFIVNEVNASAGKEKANLGFGEIREEKLSDSLRVARRYNQDTCTEEEKQDHNYAKTQPFYGQKASPINPKFYKPENIEVYDVDEQESLKSSHVFVENQIEDDPNSFIQHERSLIIGDDGDLQKANVEHLLSFADPNQHYIEYPPLQMDPSRHINHPTYSHNPLPQSNHNNLPERLKTSNSDLSQLNTILQQSKFDEKSLNNMIDMEKNFVIMQYENILQQLNLEFHKLLMKNKENEELLIQKENVVQNQNRVIAEKEDQMYQIDQINFQLKQQVQDLVQELKENEKSQRFMEKSSREGKENDIESLRLERDILESKLNKTQNQLALYQKQDQDSKEQLEKLTSRLRQAEQQLRLKEEEVYSLQKEKLSLSRDIKNLGEIESQLKLEITNYSQQRISLEDALQESKLMINSAQIQIRQRESELETLLHEIKQLHTSIEILQQNYTEISQELHEAREQTTSILREKLQLQEQIDKKEKLVRSLQMDLKNVQIEMEGLRQNMKDAERQMQRDERFGDEYMADAGKYSENRRNKNQVKFAETLQQQDMNQVYNSQRSLTLPQQSQQELPSHNTFKYQQYPYFDNNTATLNRQNSAKQISQDNTAYQSPQRNVRGGQQRQASINQQMQSNRQGSPHNQIQNTNNGKNTIQWLTYGINQNPSQQLHEEQPPPQSQQRRKTYINQTESQLHDFFNWGQQQTPKPQAPFHNSKSLDRDHQQHSTKQYQSPDQYPQGNRHQIGKQQNQEVPYAGKKSQGGGQSPAIGFGKNVKGEQQINHLQNSLSALQMDKEMLENEYRRLGTHPKNKSQIEKKQNLEEELEIVNKNIGNIKQKLRELNAL